LELLDVQGKHKGLVNYNKKNDINTLKKHACHEHLDLYKKWGLFFLQRVIKTQSEKCGSKKRKIVLPFQNTIFFLSTNNLTTNQILYNKPFWKTWFSILQRVTSLYFLLKCTSFGFAAMWACIISIVPPNGE
jgi:hypothetical protein